MWKYCNFDNKYSIQLKYMIDDTHFHIEFESSCPELASYATVYAHFEDNKSFEIGTLSNVNDAYMLNKRYSLSFLKNMSIDVSGLKYFTVKSENMQITSYDVLSEDESIKRAKNILMPCVDTDYSREIEYTVDIIENSIANYRKVKLPFFNDYNWYEIDNINDFCSISAVNHLLKSELFADRFRYWYFGKSPTERLYAVSVRCNLESVNPFSNANDCAVAFNDNKNNCRYYTVGIMLLDDGQYFCRLN